jgi:hypothetical protein
MAFSPDDSLNVFKYFEYSLKLLYTDPCKVQPSYVTLEEANSMSFDLLYSSNQITQTIRYTNWDCTKKCGDVTT